MQGWHVWLLIELLPSVCKVLGSILSTGTGGTGQETTQQLSGHSYLKSKAQAILRGHVEGGGVLVIFNKISIIWFTSEDSGARCWGKTLLERQRKHPADLPPQHTSHQESSLSYQLKKNKNKTKQKTKNKPPSNSMFLLLSTSCTPPPSLSRFLTTSYSIFFLIILCSLPVNWLLAPFLDQWLNLFNPIYNIQAKSSWIKGVC